ncbi:hypothetical protein [Sutcliffiella cohnii]|uniref:hypothetical protein n=1 Tax=Sutcliffiella cohnii TaxID=33932 RepID=UPI002E1AEC39|nr:hypothetical protein [Sutcliffiella cohnii]
MASIFKNISVVGIAGGVFSIILWINFAFVNPYNDPTMGPMLNTFFMLLLPACLAIFSSIKLSQLLMFIAFVWSVPMSIYLIATPGIFSLFGLTSAFYLVSFLLIRFGRRSTAIHQ